MCYTFLSVLSSNFYIVRLLRLCKRKTFVDVVHSFVNSLFKRADVGLGEGDGQPLQPSWFVLCLCWCVHVCVGVGVGIGVLFI